MKVLVILTLVSILFVGLVVILLPIVEELKNWVLKLYQGKPTKSSYFRIVRRENIDRCVKYDVLFSNNNRKWRVWKKDIVLYSDAEDIVNYFIKAQEEVVFEYNPNAPRLNERNEVFSES